MSGSTVTVECWGCRKSETHPIVHGEEYEKQQQEMADRGWRRRAFGVSEWDKGPWFCSEDCAHHSYNARQAESYWKQQEELKAQKEFEKYCKDNDTAEYGLLGIMAFAAILIGAAVFTECIHARLP